MQPSGGVSGPGILDLDDVRAEVGEQCRGGRDEDPLGELHDPDPFEYVCHRPLPELADRHSPSTCETAPRY